MGSKWILGRMAGGVSIGFTWLRYRPLAGCCEHGDEPSGSGVMELISFLCCYFNILFLSLLRIRKLEILKSSSLFILLLT
jgi:hypothetical protein